MGRWQIIMDNITQYDDRIEYYSNGVLHRENGPAVEWPDNREEWWYTGLRHREGGPAVIWYDGTKEWYRYGRMHRDDGPALMTPIGNKEWWLRGTRMSFDRWIECLFLEDSSHGTMMKLKWG